MRHKKNDCGKEEPDFFCDVCNAGYYSENTVREHYYHQHTDIKLWRCKRCNEPFSFKANQSRHKNACPNKNGAEIYQGRVHYDEKLEQTFKRKIAIPVQVPPNQNPVVIGDGENQEEQPRGDIEDQPVGDPPTQDVGDAPTAEDTGDTPIEVKPVEDQPQEQQFEQASDILESLSKGIIPGQHDDADPDTTIQPEEDALLDVDMNFDDK